MSIPEATVERVNELLGYLGGIAPLLGAPQVTVAVAILEALVKLLPVEPTVTPQQLAGGEEHIPGGPIPEEEA